ncbi:MAG: methyl-accepting chemotaxis protein [Armatimonadetes bacterium]|nr:methyl-accepting chemotaxis protein [Armatimonadota bacterium]
MNSYLALHQTKDESVRDFVAEATTVCKTAAEGDLEQRICHLPEDPRFADLAIAINSLLDSTDAFVRESSATLAAASKGKFYRRFIVRGMPGSFRRGAIQINDASNEMAAQAETLEEAREHRDEAFLKLESLVSESNARVESTVAEISKILGGVTVLAINARIEASRAGEASAGFGVVASEIEKMAQRITKSTDRLTVEVSVFMEESKSILQSILAS